MDDLKVTKVRDRGTRVENPMPYAPENIKLSKEQFIAKEKLRKEKELKVKEFEKSLGEDKIEVEKEPISVESKPEAKPRGRPKVIK
jgi:hypothetical protein